MAGPLQVIAVSFGPGADFEGRVLAEVDRLQGRGVLRLLDMLFIEKSEDGTVQRLVVGDDEDFGALLASIVPVDGSGLGGSPVGEGPSGFDPADAWALAESLLPGTALAFLLIEHRWAQPLFDTITETGGTLLGDGFLTSESGLLVGAEVAAMDEAAEVIAAAQAVEVRATLLAMAAGAQAAEEIAAWEAIRSAVSADAIQALITAGLVEEAAALEAVEALNAAGLIIAAADEAAGESLAEAAATARAASITMAEERVLRYLPTQLTFAVIADKLGISRSAAKDRAERAYKKLGVHNRAEAVSRARELRLLG
jgi:DNA-binding CsgD family transcriptional regulator